MRLLSVLVAAMTLAACASPVIPATTEKADQGVSEKGATRTKGDDADDDTGSKSSSDDDDDTAPGAGDDGAAAVPNPVTGLSSLPGSKLFKPAKLPAPAIVMLHGSEGGSEGSIEGFAKEMTSEGFLVLTLCWFDCKGLSSTIDRIPLEHVVNAGRWLKGTRDVNGKVGLFGWSRGAELALIVGSKTNREPFATIAVHAPSDTVVGGFDPSKQDRSPDFGAILEDGPGGKKIPAPAWTWKGKPLFGEPDASFETPGPLIDVNAFEGPLYVSQGEKDAVWPVERGKHVVQQRKTKSSLVTKSRFFAGEGHVLMKSASITTQRNDIASLFHGALD